MKVQQHCLSDTAAFICDDLKCYKNGMELKSVGFSHRSIGLVKNKSVAHSTLETAVCQDVSNCENVVSPANQKVMTHTAKGNPAFFLA